MMRCFQSTVLSAKLIYSRQMVLVEKLGGASCVGDMAWNVQLSSCETFPISWRLQLQGVVYTIRFEHQASIHQEHRVGRRWNQFAGKW